MTFRADACSMLFGLTALIATAPGCGARSDLALGSDEASSRCADGSAAGPVGCDRVTFADPVSYPAGPGLKQVVIADLDGDGALDLAVGGYADTLTVLFDNGDGAFSDSVLYPTGLVGVGGLAAGDLNDDGAVDLVAIPASDDDMFVSVLLNDGHGAFGPSAPYASGQHLSALALGDLDGDGLLDVAVTNVFDNVVRVLSNSGDGTFAPPVTLGSVTLPTGLGAADLNGDGRLDLVVESSELPAIGGTFFMNAGGGTFVGPIDYGYNGRFLGIVDVNGDGRPDYMNDGLDGLEVRLNAGDGTFGDVVSYPVAQHRSTESLAIADLNGDCRPDFAAVSEDDVVRVLPNLGDGTFGPADAHPVKGGAYSVAAGDLDGDGKVDLAVAYVGFEEVTVLLNRGCGP